MRQLFYVSVIVLLAGISTCLADTRFDINFDEDLDGFTPHRGIWKWSDRASLNWRIPEGGNGFAIYDTPGEGDELYSGYIPIENGLNYTIKYFLASEWPASTTLALRKLSLGGEYLETIHNYVSDSDPSNTEWFTDSGYVPPGPDSVFSVFCQSGNSNPEEVTGYLWGCAVDFMILITGPDLDSTTVQPTTAEKTDPATTTAEPTEPATTTAEPTDPATTTAEPTDPASTTATTTILTTTTPIPEGVIDFDFNNDTAGWVLGSSNGAAWRRLPNEFDIDMDPSRANVIKVLPKDMNSGVVMAMSPRVITGESGKVVVEVEYFMKGSEKYPSNLVVRRSTTYRNYDDVPILQLEGTSSTGQWLATEQSLKEILPGEVFYIVLEGYLGINNLENGIAVSKITITGAYLADESYDVTVFDFENGIMGWSMGSIDGGLWLDYTYYDINNDFSIPKPTNGGRKCLMANTFDAHSGIITIETPPIFYDAFSTKTLNLYYWVKASATYPVSFRVRHKTMDGEYDSLPFVDVTPQIDSDSEEWHMLDQSVAIPTNGEPHYFQLVFEADVGSAQGNVLVIDNVRLGTTYA